MICCAGALHIFTKVRLRFWLKFVHNKLHIVVRLMQLLQCCAALYVRTAQLRLLIMEYRFLMHYSLEVLLVLTLNQLC